MELNTGILLTAFNNGYFSVIICKAELGEFVGSGNQRIEDIFPSTSAMTHSIDSLNKVRRKLKLLFLLLVFLNIFFSSWYVLNQDIRFTTDIGKDFFLFKEIGEKIFVLVGSKSSTNLYHGPLWFYLNYPAFFLGHGNPVVVGWFWVILGAFSVLLNYYVGKKLFGKTTGYLFALMTSIYVSFHTNSLFNSHGAMFIIPLFFMLFIKYFQTMRLKYLILNIVSACVIVQFQLADGIPLLILSFFAFSYKAFKEKKLNHLLSYILVPVLFGNFILFDSRHEHILVKPLLEFLSPKLGGSTFNYLLYLPKKIQLMFGGVEILRQDPGGRNLVLFLIFLVFSFVQIKNNKHKLIYISFLYFYFGFFLLSLINKGDILYFYFYPIFPLVFLIFSSFVTSRYKSIFLIIFVIVLFFNEKAALSDIRDSSNIIGKDLYSWKFLYNISSKAFKGGEKEFGYFVYSPDVVAYEEKYAMDYLSSVSKKKTFRSQKKDVTYLIIAPPPPNNPYMKGEWWTKNMVKINSKPVSSVSYGNGYIIEKYILTPEEQKIQADPNLDPGLTFR